MKCYTTVRTTRYLYTYWVKQRLFIFRKSVNSSHLAKCSKYVTSGHANSFMVFRRNALSVEHILPLHSKFTVVNRYGFSFPVFFLNFAFCKYFKCLLVYGFSAFVVHLNYFLEQRVLFVYLQLFTLEFCSSAEFVTVICSIECRVCVCL
jgi:hypothetical protein